MKAGSLGNLKILKSCEPASPFEMRQLVALLQLLCLLRYMLMSDICATVVFGVMWLSRTLAAQGRLLAAA
jgi:hypothetical protein